MRTAVRHEVAGHHTRAVNDPILHLPETSPSLGWTVDRSLRSAGRLAAELPVVRVLRENGYDALPAASPHTGLVVGPTSRVNRGGDQAGDRPPAVGGQGAEAADTSRS